MPTEVGCKWYTFVVMKHDKTTHEDEWKKKLTPEQYSVLRKKGTERPFTGELLDNKRDGMYICAGCGAALFSSKTKYDSGSGWPSFWDAVDANAIELHEDNSLFMKRTGVVCAQCGGHLGHVFNDGPKDTTGQRYCINSAALSFDSDKDTAEK